MSSFTAIANRALSLLGQNPIVSLEDKTPAAEEINRVMPFVLDSVFRMHPWNCLVVRKSLAPTNDLPVYEYDYQYNLPSDCLRLLDVSTETDSRYTVEGRRILTNAGPEIFIRYVAESLDPNQYDGLLREALAAYLAATICERITQSNNKRDLANMELDKALAHAKRVDAQENPPVGFKEDSWISSRYWR